MMFSLILLLFTWCCFGSLRLICGEILCRCYDDGVHADEELYPALNESNPVLKNKKVSRVRFMMLMLMSHFVSVNVFIFDSDAQILIQNL